MVLSNDSICLYTKDESFTKKPGNLYMVLHINARDGSNAITYTMYEKRRINSMLWFFLMILFVTTLKDESFT